MIFHLEGINDKTSDNFKSAITSQIEARKQEIQKERERNTAQVMLDFSFLRDHMTKGRYIRSSCEMSAV